MVGIDRRDPDAMELDSLFPFNQFKPRQRSHEVVVPESPPILAVGHGHQPPGPCCIRTAVSMAALSTAFSSGCGSQIHPGGPPGPQSGRHGTFDGHRCTDSGRSRATHVICAKTALSHSLKGLRQSPMCLCAIEPLLDVYLEHQSKMNAERLSKMAKIGRNQPCPCGSGLKYKKCLRDEGGQDPDRGCGS